MAEKDRLDKILVDKNIAVSRQRAKALIMTGKVLVNGIPADKPGSLVLSNSEIRIKGGDMPYVSRGGLKLEAALESFGVNVENTVCLDVGASTGGFTDCLLRRGAKRVYAVDVGYGQLAWKLRNDPKVVVIERTNIRHMPKETVPEPADLATIDVSFISLKIVVPSVLKFMKNSGKIIALIKPQFEVGRKNVGKGGVVRDPALHEEVLNSLTDFFEKEGFTGESPVTSPILGPKGNREFLVCLKLPSENFVA